MRDVTVKRVPLKRGLDLQGGMHLALELDQSQKVSADPPRDIDLALTVLRKRIDEFGVTEPLIQKAGERPHRRRAGRHHRDPARAKAIVQRSAFLEFRITDKTGALEKALPAHGPGAAEPGRAGRDRASATTPTAVAGSCSGDSAKPADTRRGRRRPRACRAPG